MQQVTLNDVLAKMAEYHLVTTQNFERIDKRIDGIEKRMDSIENRVDDLAKRVDDNYVDLVNRIDEVELKIDLIAAEQRTSQQEQQVFNTKIDERVNQLEVWRNSYR